MKIHIVNGEFWADDGVPVEYPTAKNAIEEVQEFLVATAEAGMTYTYQDVDAVLDDGTVIDYVTLLEMAYKELAGLCS